MTHPLHDAADSIEPRLRRAFRSAALRLRAMVAESPLERAITDGDTRAAQALVPSVEQIMTCTRVFGAMIADVCA